MEENIWDVSVSNRDCYLDSKDGFMSELAAITWAVENWGDDIIINTGANGIPNGHYHYISGKLMREGFWGDWNEVESFRIK